MFIKVQQGFGTPRSTYIAIDSIERFREVTASTERPRHLAIRTKSGGRYVIEAIEWGDRPDETLAIASLPIIPAVAGYSVIEVPRDGGPVRPLRDIPIIGWRVRRSGCSETGVPRGCSDVTMPLTVRSYSGETFIRYPDGRIVNSDREFASLAELEKWVRR